MPVYLAFGLRIDSERALPDGVCLDPVQRSEQPSDVIIRWSPEAPDAADAARTAGGDGWFEFETADLHRYGWPDVGVVEVRNARDVTVKSVAHPPVGLIEHVLLGPVIADALLSRGMVPLHASANRIAERAVAFVGHSGQGKSTLAAAVHRAGHPAHADDLIALPVQDEPLVPFGISRIKLNLDSAASLGEDPSQMGLVYEGIEKRTKVVATHGSPPPCPLAAVYQLVDADELAIRPMDPRKAVFALFMNCFWVEVSQHACGTQELLRRCAAVAERVPFFELHRPRDFAQLAKVVDAVVAHATSLEHGTP